MQYLGLLAAILIIGFIIVIYLQNKKVNKLEADIEIKEKEASITKRKYESEKLDEDIKDRMLDYTTKRDAYRKLRGKDKL